MCIELDDPIQHDPNWKHADPTTFFVRVFAQQLTPQRRNMLQKYGLALGLFRDVGVVEWPSRYNLRAEIEAELEIPIEHFMGMGHVTFALRTAEHQGNKCIGTFTPMMLAKAFRDGIALCVPETWTRFLDRVSCDRDEFRRVAQEEPYKVRDSLFEQFGFNPLRRFPIINLGESRYLAVDPELIVERVTLGLFYDLFERDRTTFSERFGYAFDQFVGELLASVCPPDRLWSAAEWEQRAGYKKPQSLKRGDWAYIGDDVTVLFECKSLRPSVKLTTYGSDESVAEAVSRVASAVEQLIGHREGINEGKWEQAGLLRRPTVAVVVTYGQIYTINGPFARKRVHEILAGKGLEPIPFVVLSLEELDMTIGLVENGHPLDGLMESLATDEDSFDPIYSFQHELKDCALSSLTLNKGQQFMDSIVPNKADA
ncbi:MAG: hypothetical protein ACYTG0_13820 [Planctomycetota bacterium]